jgi:hypothetical protein
LRWTGGAVFYEDIFVGRNFTGPNYLAESVHQRQCIQHFENAPVDCTELNFDPAYQCYKWNNIQSIQPDKNIDSAELKWGGVEIICQPGETEYVVNFDDITFNKIKWWNLVNCNTEARWSIIVSGNNVVFQGDTFRYAKNGFVTFVIIPTGVDLNSVELGDCVSNVTVRTDINGNIFAPFSFVRQVLSSIDHSNIPEWWCYSW